MKTLITLVVLSRPALGAHPILRQTVRHAVFSERIRLALGEAWRILVG